MPFGRKTDDTRETTVRQYGLLGPNDWGEDVLGELWRENRLWNRLVEIEHDHREKYRALMAELPEIAPLEKELAEVSEKVSEAVAARKAKRKKARARLATEVEDEIIREGRARAKELRATLKERRRAARDEMKPALKALEAERREAVKHARQPAQSGLYWGNYNAVVGSYDTARVRAMKENAMLKFHHFDGSGRLTVQIQGGMSPEELFAGKHSQLAVAPVDPRAWTSSVRGERRRLARTELRFLAFTYRDENGKAHKRYLTCPMVMHRPIPEDGIIKAAVIARRRVGSKFRWSVSFTVSVPKADAPARHARAPRAAINFGWRQTPRGLRVALLVDESGAKREVLLPAVMARRLERVEVLRSARDQAVNELWPGLRTALSGVDRAAMPEAFGEAIERLLRAPKVGSRALAKLWIVWQREAREVEPEWFARLSRWRGEDKKRWDEAVNLSRKLSARRTDIYRNAALDLCRDYSEIIVGDTDFRALARRRDVGEDLPQSARHGRVLAAPGELRKWLALQSEKTGTQITVMKSRDMTLVCNACGHKQNVEEGRNRPSMLHWQCGHCSEQWDQDENHAKNLLAEHQETA
jgi:hypothetical protein